MLDDRRIILGVGGGIAAYKAPELVRRLMDAGADVQVMLTSAGGRFVSGLSLEVVSEHPVGSNLWVTDGASGIVHTDVGQEADLFVLAPATANLIARIGHGFADDLLTTSIMACRTPVLVCPSMNTDMLENPIVQRNLDLLRADDRYTVLDPGVGLLACGVTGTGRQPDPPEIIEAAAAVLTPSVLSGIRVTISAGPTREAIDPVRFVTNRSTGTMGFALARAFAASGAEVTLIAGPVNHRTPVGVSRRIEVTTASDVATAVEDAWPDTDVLVMTAAVADFRPVNVASQKIKKTDDDLTLAFERTIDVLKTSSQRPDRTEKLLIGFAAETEDVAARAAGKLKSKDLDWIIGNDVSRPDVGFGLADNAGVLLGRDGSNHDLPRSDKQVFALAIVHAVTPNLRKRFGQRSE